MKTLTHRYPSAYRAVTQARHDVAAFASGCGLAGGDTDDIALAVGEACNNAAEHGHVAGGHFTVGCSCDNVNFSVEVCDEGKGFLLAGQGEWIEPELRGVRGLGIFLMRALMDEVVYQITQHGTRVRLTKHIKAGRQLTPPGEKSHNAEPLLIRLDNPAEPLLESFRIQSGNRR